MEEIGNETKRAIRRLLDDIPKTKGLVVGDIMLDEYYKGKTKGVSPEFPVPLLEMDEVHYELGGASNVAHKLKCLGLKDVMLIGTVGVDMFADKLRFMFSNENIAYFDFTYPGSTTRKIRIVQDGKHICRVDRDACVSAHRGETEDRIVEFLTGILSTNDEIDFIIVSDYGKGVVSERLCKTISDYKKDHVKVILDPKPCNRKVYKFLDFDVITPNREEARQLLQKSVGIADGLVKGVYSLYDAPCVLTCGDEGYALFYGGSRIRWGKALEQNVKDVCGAGDIFNAILGICLANGECLETACSVANVAAALSITQEGTGKVTKDMLRRIIRE